MAAEVRQWLTSEECHLFHGSSLKKISQNEIDMIENACEYQTLPTLKYLNRHATTFDTIEQLTAQAKHVIEQQKRMQNELLHDLRSFIIHDKMKADLGHEKLDEILRDSGASLTIIEHIQAMRLLNVRFHTIDEMVKKLIELHEQYERRWHDEQAHRDPTQSDWNALREYLNSPQCKLWTCNAENVAIRNSDLSQIMQISRSAKLALLYFETLSKLHSSYDSFAQLTSAVHKLHVHAVYIKRETLALLKANAARLIPSVSNASTFVTEEAVDNLFIETGSGLDLLAHCGCLVTRNMVFSSFEDLKLHIFDAVAHIEHNRQQVLQFKALESALTKIEQRQLVLSVLLSDKCSLVEKIEKTVINDAYVDNLIQVCDSSRQTIVILQYLSAAGKRYVSLSSVIQAFNDCVAAANRQKQVLHELMRSEQTGLLKNVSPIVISALTFDDAERLFLQSDAGPLAVQYCIDLEDEGKSFNNLDTLIDHVKLRYAWCSDVRATDRLALRKWLSRSQCTLFCGDLSTNPSSAVSNANLIALSNMLRGSSFALALLDDLQLANTSFPDMASVVDSLQHEFLQKLSYDRRSQCLNFLQNRYKIVDFELFSESIDSLLKSSLDGIIFLYLLRFLNFFGKKFKDIKSFDITWKRLSVVSQQPRVARRLLFVSALTCRSCQLIPDHANQSESKIDELIDSCGGVINALVALWHLQEINPSTYHTFDEFSCALLHESRSYVRRRKKLENNVVRLGLILPGNRFALEDYDQLIHETKNLRTAVFFLETLARKGTQFSSMSQMLDALRSTRKQLLTDLTSQNTLIIEHTHKLQIIPNDVQLSNIDAEQLIWIAGNYRLCLDCLDVLASRAIVVDNIESMLHYFEQTLMSIRNLIARLFRRLHNSNCTLLSRQSKKELTENDIETLYLNTKLGEKTLQCLELVELTTACRELTLTELSCLLLNAYQGKLQFLQERRLTLIGYLTRPESKIFNQFLQLSASDAEMLASINLPLQRILFYISSLENAGFSYSTLAELTRAITAADVLAQKHLSQIQEYLTSAHCPLFGGNNSAVVVDKDVIEFLYYSTKAGEHCLAYLRAIEAMNFPAWPFRSFDELVLAVNQIKLREIMLKRPTPFFRSFPVYEENKQTRAIQSSKPTYVHSSTSAKSQTNLSFKALSQDELEAGTAAGLQLLSVVSKDEDDPFLINQLPLQNIAAENDENNRPLHEDDCLVSEDDRDALIAYLGECLLFSDASDEIEVTPKELDEFIISGGGVTSLIDRLRMIDAANCKFISFQQMSSTVLSSKFNNLSPVVVNKTDNVVPELPVFPIHMQSRQWLVDTISETVIFNTATAPLEVTADEIDSIIKISGGPAQAVFAVRALDRHRHILERFNELLPAVFKLITSERQRVVDWLSSDECLLFKSDIELSLEVHEIDNLFVLTDGAEQLLVVLRNFSRQQLTSFQDLCSLVQKQVINDKMREQVLTFLSAESCELLPNKKLQVSEDSVRKLIVLCVTAECAVFHLRCLNDMNRHFSDFKELAEAVSIAMSTGSFCSDEQRQQVVDALHKYLQLKVPYSQMDPIVVDELMLRFHGNINEGLEQLQCTFDNLDALIEHLRET